MPYKNTFIIVLAALLLGASQNAVAQTPVPAKSVPIQKFKPPTVKTNLGRMNGINANCTATEAKQLVTLPLKVVDDKKNEYVISSYQLAYTRVGITEDEMTGATSPTTDMVGQRFVVTPLPEIWQNNMIESLKKGEQLYFFDIVCYDKQKRLFFAPSLKIKII
jgi:hypothetical protein